MSQTLSRFIRYAAASAVVLALSVAPANAQHRLCDPGAEDCRGILIEHIRAETLRIDAAFWFMEDPWVAAEIIGRFRAGVPVRILMDTEANNSNARNRERLAELQAAGIPMREKVSSGIMHWKAMIFAGQNVVEFSGANYSSDAWLPVGAPYVNYVDEGILFTSKPSVVNSFKTKFDDLWTDTSSYQNYANVSGQLHRVYATVAIDPELNFPPGESYATRAVQSYYAETQRIDAIMYRITDRRHSDALIDLRRNGMPIRLITEPQQYRDPNRPWHSWNVDRLYMAGVQIKHRAHAGLNHQKSVLLYGSGLTIFGSSNWTSPSAASQEEHNYFTRDASIFRWFADQFERKWNNAAGVVENLPFTPLPPDTPADPAPAERTANVPTASVGLSWVGGLWAHEYDIYLGTNPGNLPLVGSRLPLGPSLSPGQRQSFAVPTALQANTVYYWRVVARTAADLTAASPIWSFVTGGQVSGGLPSVTLDATSLSFGATMRTGSFEAAGGPQTVRLRQNGAGQVAWTASASDPWITVTPASGTGDGDLVIGVRYAPGLPTAGDVRGVVVIDATGAANTPPPIQVALRLTQAGLANEPFGSFDTPVDGMRNVTGSIAVTGWALDDVQVTSVRIYRNCLPIDGARCQTIVGERLAYIADAGFIEGSRPDVQASHPSLPNASRAGWGYLLLTNMLPHLPSNRSTGGQGDLTLYAVAADADGHATLLGRRTIQADNDNASSPFGAIDSPAQGETVSGTIAVFGWALTPGAAMIPVDGSTITLHVDGRPVARVAYNLCRGTTGSPAPIGRCNDDIATLFPAYMNITQAGGAIIYTTLDTTRLGNGLHTVELSVTDDQGRSAGLGSRFIRVQNR